MGNCSFVGMVRFDALGTCMITIPRKIYNMIQKDGAAFLVRASLTRSSGDCITVPGSRIAKSSGGMYFSVPKASVRSHNIVKRELMQVAIEW